MRDRAKIRMDSIRKRLAVIEEDISLNRGDRRLTPEHRVAHAEAHRLVADALAAFEKADAQIEALLNKVEP